MIPDQAVRTALAALDRACERLLGAGGKVNHQAVGRLVTTHFRGATPIGAGGRKTVYAISATQVVKVGNAADVQETWDTYTWLPAVKRGRLWAPITLRGKYVILQARGTAVTLPTAELVRWQRMGRTVGLIDLNPDNLMRAAGRVCLVDARLSGIAARRLTGQRKQHPLKACVAGELVSGVDEPVHAPSLPPVVAVPTREAWQVLGLSQDEERFCQEFVGDAHENATAAVHRAQLRVTRSSAAQTGKRLLDKPPVQQRIAQLKQAALALFEKKKRTPITVERILQEWAGMAFADRRTVHRVTDDGTVLIAPTSEWPEEAAAAVAGIKQTSDGLVNIDFHDKDRALAHLARYLRMFPEHTAVAGSVQVGQAVIYIPDNQRSLAPPVPVPVMLPGGGETNGHPTHRPPESAPAADDAAAARETEDATELDDPDPDVERELGLD